MQKVKKRVGRPTRPPRPGERVTLGLRVSADLKRKLEKDAVKAARSLSQEAELRLEQSYDREWIVKRIQAKVVEAWLKTIKGGKA
jgi:predicted transcriptional regulator